MSNQFGFRDRLDQIEIGAGRPGGGDILRFPLRWKSSAPAASRHRPRSGEARAQKLKPSIRGMLMSTITRSNGCDSALSIASMPLIACSTSKPAFSSAER